MTYCWKDKVEYMKEKHGFGSEQHIAAFFAGGQCLLLKDHDGEHAFTDDKLIQLALGYNPDGEQ
jgi:hypothetical protein